MAIMQAIAVRPIFILFAVALAAAAVGAGLAGWLDRGVDMFLTLAEAGLAWCF